jgi:Mn2+/Fe2+ NRAMP family transporter
VAVPLIFLILRVSSRADVMGTYRSGRCSRLGLWVTFALMGAAAVALLASIVFG